MLAPIVRKGRAMLRKFIANEDGATAIEYGLIAGIICIGLVAGFIGLRDNLNLRYQNVAETVGNS